jgi:HEAT repeat protein
MSCEVGATTIELQSPGFCDILRAVPFVRVDFPVRLGLQRSQLLPWDMAMMDLFRKPVFRCSVFVAAAALLLVWLFSGETTSTPEELVDRSFNAPTVNERQTATIELSRRDDVPIKSVRDVFRQSKSPEVRAAAVQGLGRRRDVNSLSALIDAMEDESPLVRGRAGAAVRRIVGLNYEFHALDPPEKRQKAVAFYRKFWKEAQGTRFVEFTKDPSRVLKETKASREGGSSAKGK